MTGRFEFLAADDGGVVTLAEPRLIGRRPVPVDRWADAAGPSALPAVRFLRRLLDEGQVRSNGTSIHLSNDQLADLPAAHAREMGLPDIAPLSLELILRSRVEAPDGEISLRWTDANGRSVAPRVSGLLVGLGRGAGRLSSTLYRVVKAVAAYNATRGRTGDERIPAWLPVQSLLESMAGEPLRADRVLQNFRIYQGGAFALDVRQSGEGPNFDPVLMSPAMRQDSDRDDAPAPEAEGEPSAELADDSQALLPPALRLPFLRSFAAGPTRPSYVLQRQTFLVLDPELQLALDVVKRMQVADPETRNDFLRNPRSYLAQAMPDGGSDLGTLFVETRQYSERVRGLGLWVKPRLAWLVAKGNQWLPERFIVRIGEQMVELDETQLRVLADLVERAERAGVSTVEYAGSNFATGDVAEMLERLEVEPPVSAPQEHGRNENELTEPPQVLIIDENIEEQGYAVASTRRPSAAPKVFPADHVLTTPKPHQIDGFSWLVDAWLAGLPGVLLADDMGLGKTMQALSFLAWFRENRRQVGAPQRAALVGPILIVAPTALLRNWRAEAARHLTPSALGTCVEAYGSQLVALKKGREALPEDALDLDTLRNAGWVLTTYETLANYHRAFARVAFPVAIFDEMQKIKSPATINTHAAKAMNADFVLGMTGTPIENRIEDLWCLMDRVAPGRLGPLKTFSKTYGSNDPAALAELKDKLDRGINGLPALMLRRMKEDHLDGLPPRAVVAYNGVAMPQVQADAYADTIARARTAGANGRDMLQIIHALRGISLHPHGGDGATPGNRTQWADQSARMVQAFMALDEIHAKGEKALVFIEDRSVQTIFSAAIAERYGLGAEPTIVNGATPGERRREIVDRFQASPPGFGVLLLSPKAAGMGLTITAANHVIHLSRWWNPAVEDQCNDRVYRIGQSKPVTVHIPIARHPVFQDTSFDVRLDRLLSRKRELARTMLVPPLTDSDAEELFKDTVGATSSDVHPDE